MIKMGEIYHYKLYHDKTGKYLRMLENNIQVKPFPTKVESDLQIKRFTLNKLNEMFTVLFFQKKFCLKKTLKT